MRCWSMSSNLHLSDWRLIYTFWPTVFVTGKSIHMESSRKQLSTVSIFFGSIYNWLFRIYLSICLCMHMHASSIYSSLHLSFIYPSIIHLHFHTSLSIHPSTYVCSNLSIHLSAYLHLSFTHHPLISLSIYYPLSSYPFTSSSIPLSAHLLIHSSSYLFIYLSIHSPSSQSSLNSVAIHSSIDPATNSSFIIF